MSAWHRRRRVLAGASGIDLAPTWPLHARGVGPFLTGLGGSGRVWLSRNPLQSLDIRLSAMRSRRPSIRRFGVRVLRRPTHQTCCSATDIAAANGKRCVAKPQFCPCLWALLLQPTDNQSAAHVEWDLRGSVDGQVCASSLASQLVGEEGLTLRSLAPLHGRCPHEAECEESSSQQDHPQVGQPFLESPSIPSLIP